MDKRPTIPEWLKPAGLVVGLLDANAAHAPRAAARGNPGQAYFSQTVLALFNQAGGVFRYRTSREGTPPTPKRRLSRSCIPQRLGRRLSLSNYFWLLFIQGSVA
jgi:hypothetical protein